MLSVFYLVFQIAIYVFAFIGFIRFIRLLWQKKNAKKPDTRPIHVIYPTMQFWEIGDNFVWFGSKLKFLGFAEAKFFGEVLSGDKKYYKGQIVTFSIDRITYKDCVNNKAKAREASYKKVEVLSRVRSDQTNTFLKELRELNKKYLQEESSSV